MTRETYNELFTTIDAERRFMKTNKRNDTTPL